MKNRRPGDARAAVSGPCGLSRSFAPDLHRPPGGHKAAVRKVEAIKALRQLRHLRNAYLPCQPYLPYLTRPLMAFPMSAGLFTTWTPAAVNAAIFSAAVPLPPAMMAPAWPMRRPG